jgi:hypothetical protein
LSFIYDFIAVGWFINETISPKLGLTEAKEKYNFLPKDMKYRYDSIVSFPIREIYNEDPKNLEVENVAFLSFNFDDLNDFMKKVQKTVNLYSFLYK